MVVAYAQYMFGKNEIIIFEPMQPILPVPTIAPIPGPGAQRLARIALLSQAQAPALAVTALADLRQLRT